jgi:gliding motility-associated protein GldC
MKKSEIKFTVELDDQKIPDKILWEATDNPHGRPEETKAIAISVWDNDQKNTMRIDLWGKDMRVDEMKVFFIETIAGISETLLTSTGDQVMADDIKQLVKKLVKHVEEENKKNALG